MTTPIVQNFCTFCNEKTEKFYTTQEYGNIKINVCTKECFDDYLIICQAQKNKTNTRIEEQKITDKTKNPEHGKESQCHKTAV